MSSEFQSVHHTPSVYYTGFKNEFALSAAAGLLNETGNAKDYLVQVVIKGSSGQTAFNMTGQSSPVQVNYLTESGNPIELTCGVR